MPSTLLRAILCLALLTAGVARAEESSDSSSEGESSESSGSGGVSNTPSGELNDIGAMVLQTRGNRIGVRAGPAKIGQAFYLAGSIELDLSIKQFSIGLGTPINIPVYDPAKGLKLFPDGMKLRQQDYATPQNFIRIFRYMTLGKKEGDYYLNFSQQYAATIGHGGAVRRYISNLDVNKAKLAGEFDMKFKYGGFETYVGDVLKPLNMVGALAYLKPLGFSDNIALKSLSFGVTYAGDLNAPLTLQRLGEHPVLDSSFTPQVADSRKLHIVGVSIETKVVKNKTTDIKPYIYADQMLLSGGPSSEKLGGGLSIGALGRFGFGENGKHAIRVVLEGRVFQDKFLPGYFDSFYDIQRYQYFGPNDNPAASPTKLANLLGRSEALKFGGYAEFQYAWGRHFAFAASYEDSNAKGGRNVMLHAEVPTFEYVRLFGTVYYRGIDGVPGVSTQAFGDQLKATNTIYFAGARVKLLPILFLNFRAFRSWQMDQSSTSNGYKNVDGFQIDAEVGYEFSRK